MPFSSQSQTADLTAQQQVVHVASAQSVHRAFDWFRLHESKLREIQMELAAIPAPPFGLAAFPNSLEPLRYREPFALEERAVEELRLIARS